MCNNIIIDRTSDKPHHSTMHGNHQIINIVDFFGIVYNNECVEKCCQKERDVEINRDDLIGNV